MHEFALQSTSLANQKIKYMHIETNLWLNESTTCLQLNVINDHIYHKQKQIEKQNTLLKYLGMQSTPSGMNVGRP